MKQLKGAQLLKRELSRRRLGPGGVIQSRIKAALAMISSGKVEWPRLIADGESVGLGVAQQQETFRQLFISSTRAHLETRSSLPA